ncbi:MAG: Uma2 family endonuclease [Labilithrix sp.]|nr:Uma2 family endonuclease [Labilithrix sp.]MCW5811264.1 Uma2 family endonuclease [Labilithrix sp.]
MQRFPGKGGIPVDERIVKPESRAEIVEGRLVFAPPSDEPHAVPHADLTYLLRAHVKPGYLVAVDMLTRAGLEQDFAPDASVYPAARDEVTGGRQLEELAFEIVNEQALATQTTKARELAGRGVRRIFVVQVKRSKALEWSRDTDAWSATPLDTIDDPCFVRPLSMKAVISAIDADEAVLRALRAKGHPVLDEVREEGREAGLARGLRIAVRDLCEAYGIPLDAPRAHRIDAMSAADLETLRITLKHARAWPE